jgi:hypothetical protein
VDASLREHFDRAIGDDPGADLGEMAHAAIVEGGRVRRRRRQMAVAGVTAGAAVLVAVVAGVTHRSPATAPADPAAVAPRMMLVAAADCSAEPVAGGATDVVIVPGDAAGQVSDAMVAQLRSALQHDPRVRALRYETHEDAYQRFRNLWSDDPDFVASVSANDLPELFRLRLADPSQYAIFRKQYAGRADVMVIEGRICRTSAPVGGIK